MTAHQADDPHLRDHSFEELADALANAAVGIHWVGPDGKLIWANAAELELLGYEAAEYIGHHVAEFHVDENVIGDILHRLSCGETLHSYEARLKTKDGSIKNVLITSNVRRKDGEFVHTRCFTRDISERKQMELELRSTMQTLQATVQRFDAVLHQMPSAVAVVEAPSGQVILANAKNQDIFRQALVPLADVSEYRRFHGLHEDGREIKPEEWPLSRSISSGEIVAGEEIHVVRGDGSHGYIRVNSAPIRDAHGTIVAGVVTYDDVTEQKDAQHKLYEQNRVNEILLRIGSVLGSELKLDALMQKLTDEATTLCRAQFGAFFHNVTDERGESYMLYTISGVPREAFSKFPMPRNTSIFAPTFAGTGVMRLDDVTQDVRYGKSAPYHGMPEGHLPVRSYLAASVKARSGEVLGGLFFGHATPGMFTENDEQLLVAVAAQAAIAIENARMFEAAKRSEAAEVVARQKLERLVAELEAAATAKDEFLATVSHELRTPLSAILGWTRMLRSGSLADDRRERALETIERNAKSQAQLIEDLLDVSRIISGKLRVQVATMDLSGAVNAAIDALRPAANARGVTLRHTIEPDVSPVLGDADRLQQVMWNLVSNAVKFTPQGGSVQVEVRRVHSNVEIIVRDSGQGIDPAFLPHVFERFRQADASTTRQHGGLGLGLAIVRHLVELHGGTTDVKSDGLGKGSTFIVKLPISPVRAPVTERAVAPHVTPVSAQLPHPPQLDGVRVLVLDDERDARELLAEALATCGAKVTLAASVSEAIAAVQRVRPEIVVSDIGMPGEDGYAFIRQLRELPANAGGRTPAVALTAYARMEDRTKALVAGFNMHVPKPVALGELLVVLASLTNLVPRRS